LVRVGLPLPEPRPISQRIKLPPPQSGVAATDQNNLANAINTFMTSRGINVY
jgi:hypothetical protein